MAIGMPAKGSLICGVWQMTTIGIKFVDFVVPVGSISTRNWPNGNASTTSLDPMPPSAAKPLMRHSEIAYNHFTECPATPPLRRRVVAAHCSTPSLRPHQSRV